MHWPAGVCVCVGVRSSIDGCCYRFFIVVVVVVADQREELRRYPLRCGRPPNNLIGLCFSDGNLSSRGFLLFKCKYSLKSDDDDVCFFFSRDPRSYISSFFNYSFDVVCTRTRGVPWIQSYHTSASVFCLSKCRTQFGKTKKKNITSLLLQYFIDVYGKRLKINRYRRISLKVKSKNGGRIF